LKLLFEAGIEPIHATKCLQPLHKKGDFTELKGALMSKGMNSAKGSKLKQAISAVLRCVIWYQLWHVLSQASPGVGYGKIENAEAPKQLSN